MEREACCDAFGVTATGDESTYLDTLALWAEKMKHQSSPTTPGALAFADRKESTLLDRVRRVLFPDFVPAARFSPISTLFLFAIGLVLFASLWQGTMLAVQVADKLLPHEQVVAELTETRNEYEGEPFSPTQASEEPKPMTVKFQVKTEDDKPTTCKLRIDYDNFNSKTGGTLQAYGGAIKPGKTEHSLGVKQGWANILVTSEDYAPVAFRNVRPDKDGVANLILPLRSGFPGKIKVVSEDGKPIANANIELSKTLKSTYKKNSTPNMKWTRTTQSATIAVPFTSNQDGVVTVEHATDQPLFEVEVKAPGFEGISRPPFAFKKGHAHEIVMKRAVPVVGRVTDKGGQPLADVKIHILSSIQRTDTGSMERSGNVSYCQKAFGDVVATTSENGEFTINTLESGWAYNLIADAGDRGLATSSEVRPGDKEISIEIAGPINVSGMVTGAIERLKHGDKYVLPYGISVRSPRGIFHSDGRGRSELSVVNGTGTFLLKNVMPGEFEFYDSTKIPRTSVLESVPVFNSIDDLQIVIPSTDTPGVDAGTIVRRARLKFEPASGAAPFRGLIDVSSRVKNNEVHSSRQVEVVGGVAEFDVNAPTKLFVEIMDAPGFLFEKNSRKTELEIDAADGEFEGKIDVFPAGAIFGQIKVVNPREGGWFGVYGEMKWKSSTHSHSTTIRDECDADGKFYLPNVPYEATFELIARQGANGKTIEVPDIDKSQPLFKAVVTLEDGPALRGKVLDWQGKPFANRAISLRVMTEGSYSYTQLSVATTNQNGAFNFGPVNPDLGEYKIWIETDKDQAQSVTEVADIKAPLNIKLDRGLIIEGRLINDETGEPIVDAEVYASPSKYRPDSFFGYEAEARTDANGAFKFSNLNKGDYKIGSRVLNGQEVNRDLIRAGKRDVRLRVRMD